MSDTLSQFPAMILNPAFRESNIDDVLQISNIFVNVSKGEVAKANDLEKAFGTSNTSDIVKEVRQMAFNIVPWQGWITSQATCQILKKGEVQVGEKERDHDIASLRKELATLVAEKCVDPSTQRPYPVGMIEKAMTEAGYSIKTNKTAKSQVGTTQSFGDLSLMLSIGFGVHQVAPDIVESPDTTCSDARADHCADERWEAIEGTDIGGSGTGGRRRDRSDGVGSGKCG